MVFVHLGTEEKAKKFFAPYQLLDVPRFSDPEGALYQSFGLVRGNFRQYFNVESMLRMVGTWLRGNFAIVPQGDVERMPGAFLIQDGEIQKTYRHKLISDRPNYLSLATAE
jgi:hypothetical protein